MHFVQLLLLKENKSPFSSDGWNEEWFYDIGLLDAITEIEAIAYEIRNARRGSYATDGTIEDIADQLFELAEIFNSVADELMENRDISPDEELDEGVKSGLKAAIDAVDNEYDENEYDSVDDYLETYTGGYKDEVEQHLKMKYEG